MAVAGTVAALVLLLESVTMVPPCGAADEMLTVPVTCRPPVVEAELRFSALTVTAVVTTLSTTLCDTAFKVPGFCVAVICTRRVLGTVVGVSINCACVAPAGMVTIVVAAGMGSVTVSLVVSVMAIPPAGAGSVKVSVPVDAVPPTTGFGSMLMPLSSAGGAVSISVAIFVPPFSSAVMSTEVGAFTGAVKTLNKTDVAPVGTTTVAGTVTSWLTLVRLMVWPPAKAGAEIVIIPCVVVLLGTVLGVSVNPVRESAVTGVMLSVACNETFSVANTATVTGEPTCGVAILNVAVVAPAGTITVGGVGTETLLLAIPMRVPPVGAATLMVTVPVVDWPPATVLGFKVIPVRLGGFGLGGGFTGALYPHAPSSPAKIINRK